MRRLYIMICAGTLAGSAAAPADAQPSASPQAQTAYALVVGANRGGPGQDVLQFAERDARSVAGVLTSVGRYRAANVVRLSQPSPTEVRDALADIGARLADHASRGEKTSFLFYYSGHARASSLNLATSELELPELRRQLEAVPATLTIVILDACQSGAFSRVKGITGAADFSVNSIASLNASGMAVMASSSATELSQESERLGSSYFTHYLLVALRGAGDDNRDGRVSLGEAYRYAYNRTLAATATTAVGKQHVTLETDLRGKGEIALSYPAAVGSALELPLAASGDFLIQAQPSGAVLAEVHKVKDRPVRIALAPGSYRVVIRTGDRAVECTENVAPGKTTIHRGEDCRRISLEGGARKGAASGVVWSFEISLGGARGIDDAFTDRLADFGYEREEPLLDLDAHAELTVTRELAGIIHGGISLLSLVGDDYRRSGDTEPETFTWGGTGIVASLRIVYPLIGRVDERGRPVGLVGFAEAGAGVAHSKTRLTIGEMPTVGEDHWGYMVSAAAGGQLMITPAFGLFVKLRYAVAPTIDNLLGETHDIGGFFTATGIRLSL